jgi:hypothetical protein
MTLPSSCAPCNCISSTINNEYFKQAVLTILCDILTAGGGGGAVVQAATYAASAVAGAGGAVPTTGASVLANAANARIISVGNTLDVPVLISANGGTTYPYYVPATTGTMVIDLGANGRFTASAIFAKAIGGNSSSGTLYVGLTI